MRPHQQCCRRRLVPRCTGHFRRLSMHLVTDKITAPSRAWHEMQYEIVRMWTSERNLGIIFHRNLADPYPSNTRASLLQHQASCALRGMHASQQWAQQELTPALMNSRHSHEKNEPASHWDHFYIVDLLGKSLIAICHTRPTQTCSLWSHCDVII